MDDGLLFHNPVREGLPTILKSGLSMTTSAFVATDVVLHGRSHTILIADAPISIPVAKTRIPAAPVAYERICGST